MTMFAEIYIHNALLYYSLLLLGGLTLLLAVVVFYDRSRNWSLRRLRLHTCSKCGLVFAVGRFRKSFSIKPCPRCGHRQTVGREKQSPVSTEQPSLGRKK